MTVHQLQADGIQGSSFIHRRRKWICRHAGPWPRSIPSTTHPPVEILDPQAGRPERRKSGLHSDRRAGRRRPRSASARMTASVPGWNANGSSTSGRLRSGPRLWLPRRGARPVRAAVPVGAGQGLKDGGQASGRPSSTTLTSPRWRRPYRRARYCAPVPVAAHSAARRRPLEPDRRARSPTCWRRPAAQS